MSSIYIIFPQDRTTAFLRSIITHLNKTHAPNSFNLIEVHPSDESYAKSFELMCQIPNDSIVLFMGHGQPEILYGAESDSFKKKPLVKKVDMKVFRGKYLFSLSCNSTELLRATFSQAGFINSIGFGSLPTEMTEVENNKKLKEQGITESVIKRYKDILIELVSLSLSDLILKKHTFSELSNYFTLRLNKKISEVILEDKTSKENRLLSNLLFQMRSEMIFI